MKEKIDRLNDLLKIQYQSAFSSEYQLGLYNGIEICLAILEDRGCNFLTLPIEDNI